MWKKMIAGYRSMEDESLAVLADPSLADTLPPGIRRIIAQKLAALTPFEREQFRAFSLKYYGAKMFTAIGKLVLLCTVAGVIAHVAYPKLSLLFMIGTANVIGITAIFAFIGAWYNHRALLNNKWKAIMTILACSTLGNIAGASVAGIEKGRSAMAILERLPPVILGTSAGMVVCLFLPLAVVVLMRDKHYQAWNAQLQLEAERERAARELSESSLRLLRAQIEPHFLFNTLGAVQQLAEQGAPRAAALTANLIAFLRASLSEMRTERVSLRSDFKLIESYLDVMKTRLGERLQFSLALPEPLVDVSVPSMMLLTLVENAIKHGIEPSLRGGAIHVTAARDGDRVRVRVQDSGVGMGAIPGQGHGLENVRARLALLYGKDATLSLSDAEPQGLIADVEFPLEPQKA
jgi:signal transduction histidine kinase